MAKIEVTGEVVKLLGDKGFTLAEPIVKKGDNGWETVGKRYFTVWVGLLDLPAVGQKKTVTGSFVAKLEEYQGKQVLKQTINAATIVDQPTVADIGRVFNAQTAQASAASVADEPLPF